MGTSFGTALASPESDRLIGDGIAKLQANQHKDALQLFNRALAADRNDGRAAFYQGYVLNRLGQFGPAYAAFEDMRRLGVSHPEAGYEEGWAALATGRWQRAIALLEPYERTNATNGKASEFLGRAYMAMRRFDDADAAFARAVARDPLTKPNVLYFQSQMAALRGDGPKVDEALNRLAREAPNSPAGVGLGNAVRREAVRVEKDKPWSAYLSTGIGHNSNVISFSNTIVQPTDITSVDSDFFQLDAGGEYRFNLMPATTLTAGYALRYDNYFDIAGQDVVSHAPYLTLRHAFLTDVTGALSFAGEYTEVDDQRYRSGYTVRPSAVVQTPLPNLALELFYGYSDFDYRAPANTGVLVANPADFDRDSTTHSIGLRGVYELPRINTTLDAGVARIWNSANGGDFDFRALQWSGGATARLPWRITAMASIAYVHSLYDNPNSLAPANPPGIFGYAFQREDETTSFTVRGSRPIWGPAEGFVQYDRVHNVSNIGIYEFDQHQLMGGLIARF